MSATKIRLRYSGFIALGSSLAVTAIGFAFTVMVTRRLSINDYGIWSTMGVLSSYFAMWIPSVYSYWITRDSARGKYDSARTGINISFILGVIFTVLYAVIGVPVANRLNANYWYFILFSAYILFSFSSSSYQAAARGTKPEHLHLSDLTATIVKVVVGYLLLIVLNLELTGIILASIFYMIVRVLHYRWVMHGAISKGKVKLELVKDWLSKCWIPLIEITAFILLQLDVMIVAMTTGSSEAVAHYRVVQLYMQAITSVGLVAIGLYPSLLSSPEETDVKRTLTESINLVMFLGVPAVLGVTASADHLLALLRIEYLINSNTLRIAAACALLTICASILNTALTGTEKIDLNQKTTLRAYVKSTLFTVGVGYWALPAVVLPLIAWISQAFMSSPVELVFLWYMIYIIGTVIYLLYLGVLARKSRVPIEIDLKTIASVVFSAVFSVLFVFLCGQHLVLSRSFLTMLANVFILLAVGCSYFVLLYLTSSWFRRLFADVVSFLKTLKS